MEYWEVTKERTHETLAPWRHHLPDLKINGKSVAEFEALLDQFEPLAQGIVAAQDEVDAASRTVRTALQKMKILGINLPKIIEAQLDDEEGLMRELRALYATTPRTEATILARGRDLFPVWLRANAILAAKSPPLPPLIREIQGTQFAVTGLKALLDDYTELLRVLGDQEELLDRAHEAMRKLDAQADRLNKNWYKCVKGMYDPGHPAYDALAHIPTEPSTPPPVAVEIAEVVQGGEEERQVLVKYKKRGGAHATTKLIEWTLPGDAEPFLHHAPLVAPGHALGPFPVGTVIVLRTRVANSVGTRTSAPRTLTIEAALE